MGEVSTTDDPETLTGTSQNFVAATKARAEEGAGTLTGYADAVRAMNGCLGCMTRWRTVEAKAEATHTAITTSQNKRSSSLRGPGSSREWHVPQGSSVGSVGAEALRLIHTHLPSLVPHILIAIGGIKTRCIVGAK